MTTQAIAAGSVRTPHCVVLATYSEDPETREALRLWRAERIGGPALEVKGIAVQEVDQEVGIHDVVMYSLQGLMPRALSGEEAGGYCREYVSARSLPKHGLLGKSAVILARVDRTNPDRSSRAEAEAILGVVVGTQKPALVGGLLVPGIEMWSFFDDLDWLVLLCNDDDEVEAEAGHLLYVNLRMIEMAFHKILHQGHQARREANRVAVLRDELARELTALDESLGRLDVDESPDALRLAERRGGLALRGESRLIASVGPLLSMQTSIEANRRNFLAYRSGLGKGPGRAALNVRLRRAGQERDQIRADIGYCRSVLETARVTGQSHQTRLMTVMSLNEIHENRLREVDTFRRESLAKKLTLLGLWIGLMQVATAILPFLLPSMTDALRLWLKIAFSGLLSVGFTLLIWAFWPPKSRSTL